MAANDLIKVRRVITQTVGGQTVSTNGVEELLTLGNILNGAPATATQAGASRQMTYTAPIAAAPTQADFNSLLTKLQAAGLMASS